MPAMPLSQDLEQFLAGPRRCVLATVRDDGVPVTVPCWYEYADGRVLLSMSTDARRLRHIRSNPNVALTVLGEDWYKHLSVLGHVTNIREDVDLELTDRLSVRYMGVPYPERYPGVAVTVELDTWYTYGTPGDEASR